jgi:NADH-quinone oxidoreductase subunit L
VIQAIVFLPLLAALVAGLGQRFLGATVAKAVTTAAVMIAAVLSWIIFLDSELLSRATVVEVLPWIQSGDMSVSWSLRLDRLTAVMLVVINSVSALVHLYSWGYMSEDPDQPRFFSYLSLFTFAMLMLVTADNLVQMFFGWEGVGLASYLLIGFWYHKPSANAAAIKAFVVNRVGDFGFSLGIFATFLVFGTIDIATINANAAGYAGQTFNFLGQPVDVMTTICLLLFVGAMGKSAQLGLHTWLPDAMEGPTPVSALIHAATMVTAGVFMVCRLSPMFEAAPAALTVVTYVGAATALFAATIGTVQTDIKRVIAYSTCSQLGYMFFAAGVGAYGVAMFHLFTHAFFKALLFLGAGSVIHAMHHEQDMRFYGALRRSIPITFLAMMLGTLAITGVVPFAGYYSKDAILEAAYMSGEQAGIVAFFAGSFAALLTSFYSWRLIFLTFAGRARWAGSEHIQHSVHHHHESPAGEGTTDSDEAHVSQHAVEATAAHGHGQAAGEGSAGYHPHESPVTMLVPLVLLSLGAVFAGLVFHDAFADAEAGARFWAGSLAFDAELMHAIHEAPAWVVYTPMAAWIVGLLLALRSYIWNPAAPARFTATFRGLYDFLLHKWYFDELYDVLFVRPSLWLGRFFWRRGDQGTIDRFGPDGVSAVVQRASVGARRLQTGYVYTYALVMLIGVAAAASWLMPRVFGGH